MTRRLWLLSIKIRGNNMVSNCFYCLLFSLVVVSSSQATEGAYPSHYADFVSASASKYGVDPNLVHAVIKAESGYNAAAVSRAGAAGLMQLMPDTARRYGVSSRFDPQQNIDGGTHYLRDLLAMFNNNIHLAVAGYNAGENAVIKYHYSIPPYAETQTYVSRVVGFLKSSFGFTSVPTNNVAPAMPIVAHSEAKPIKRKPKFYNVAAAKALADFYAPGSWVDN